MVFFIQELTSKYFLSPCDAKCFLDLEGSYFLYLTSLSPMIKFPCDDVRKNTKKFDQKKRPMLRRGNSLLLKTRVRVLMPQRMQVVICFAQTMHQFRHQGAKTWASSPHLFHLNTTSNSLSKNVNFVRQLYINTLKVVVFFLLQP